MSGFLGGGFLSAFLEKLSVLASLTGDPLVEKYLGSSPSAGGLAFDGTYFYLNDFSDTKIYVYTTEGTLFKTLNVTKAYTDIDYDPYSDTILAVGDAYNGIDQISKDDGSLLGTMNFTTFLNNEFTSIAVDRYYDRIYLMLASGITAYVLKAGNFDYVRLIHFPFQWAAVGQIPATMIIALDSIDRSKIWVASKTFPPILGRIDGHKVDDYVVLGASFNMGKASISVRFVNGAWYYWGEMGDFYGRLYELSRLPLPVTPFVMPTEPSFDQDIYRWYEDDIAEIPTPKAAENTGITGIDFLDILRLRLGLEETAGSSLPWSGLIKIQYATSPAGPWTDVGAIGATNRPWRLYAGLGTDKTAVANLLLSNTTVKQYFVESFPPASSMAFRSPDRGEWDFCIQAYDVTSLEDYYFRAVVYDGLIKTYTLLPTAQIITLPPYENFLLWTVKGAVELLWQTRFSSFFDVYRDSPNKHLSRDYGAGHFTDFEHLIDANIDIMVFIGGVQLYRVSLITYCNALQDWQSNRTGAQTQVSVIIREGSDANHFTFQLMETYLTNTFSATSADYNVDTDYYLKITKSGTGVALGIYSDAARTALLETVNLTLQADHSFRYILCPQTIGSSGHNRVKGVASNLDLQE